MAAIAVIFGMLGAYEWIYLRRDKQKPRTVRLVLGFNFLLLAGLEAIWILQEHWSIGMAVNAVFSPIQDWLLFRT
jgi:hypothetical protein